MQIQPLTAGRLADADALRAEAGWNQTADHWTVLLELAPGSCFFAQHNGTFAGVIAALNYNSSFGWIGMLLVKENLRGLGIGTALFKHSIQALHSQGVPAIGLDATPLGKRVYANFGFKPLLELTRWEKSGVTISSISLPQTPNHLEKIGPHQLSSVSALDRLSFGADRRSVLEKVLAQSSVLSNPERSAFGAIQRGSLAAYLGPIAARDSATAELLIRQLLLASPQPRVFWDVPDANTAAAALAAQLGFKPQRPLTRMILGPPPAANSSWLYGILDPSLG